MVRHLGPLEVGAPVTPEQAAALRAPFPPEQVGQIPKGGVMLDYVGHAATTDRLLQVDPGWSWEPMGLDAYGLPKLDEHNNLWIRLTVCGITRVGVGDGPSMKEKIGDAIRNAAMRFGVALDLWAKEPLPQGDETVTHKPKRATRVKPTQPVDDQWSTPPQDDPAPGLVPPSPGAGSPPAEAKFGPTSPITAAQVRLINVLAKDVGIDDRIQLHDGISKLLVRPVESVKALNKREAALVIESLQARLPKEAS